MARSALCSPLEWDEMHSNILEAKNDLESSLIHPFRLWLESCATVQIQKVCSEINLSDLAAQSKTKEVTTRTVCRLPNFQKLVYEYLLKHRVPFNLAQTIEYRFGLRQWGSDSMRSVYASRAATFLKEIHNHVPPCVMYAVINLWFNGSLLLRVFRSRGLVRFAVVVRGPTV